MAKTNNFFIPFTWKKALIIIPPFLLIVLGFILFGNFSKKTNMEIPRSANGNEMIQFFEGYTASNKSSQSNINKIYWGKVQYTIDHETYIDDKSGFVEITVTVPDMKNVIKEAFELCLADRSKSMTEEELNAMLQEQIITSLDGEFETVTTKIKMDTKKDESGWRLIPNDSWQDAVIGGVDEIFTTYLDQYLDAIINQIDKGGDQ